MEFLKPPHNSQACDTCKQNRSNNVLIMRMAIEVDGLRIAGDHKKADKKKRVLDQLEALHRNAVRKHLEETR